MPFEQHADVVGVETMKWWRFPIVSLFNLSHHPFIVSLTLMIYWPWRFPKSFWYPQSSSIYRWDKIPEINQICGSPRNSATRPNADAEYFFDGKELLVLESSIYGYHKYSSPEFSKFFTFSKYVYHKYGYLTFSKFFSGIVTNGFFTNAGKRWPTVTFIVTSD